MNIIAKATVVSVLAGAVMTGCTNGNLNPESGLTPGSVKIINTEQDSDQHSILVKLLSSEVSPELDSLVEARNLSIVPLFHIQEGETTSSGLERWYKIVSENGGISAVAPELAGLSSVEMVQYNTYIKRSSDGISYAYHPSATKAGSGFFNDPSLKDQWHYKNTGDKSVITIAKAGADVNVEDAWRLTTGDPGIIVAIIDEAVQPDHPDLAANMWVNEAEKNGSPGVDDDGNGYVDDVYGFNFNDNRGELSWNEYGLVGHGTHVAGTVAAVNNNGIGVSGIAGGSGNGDGVRIMSLQMFSGRGSTLDAGANAILYAAKNGAHIIQCSWGVAAGALNSDQAFETMRGAEADAIKEFISTPNDILDGGLAIFAAGNDGKGVAGYPGAYKDCICVTAFAPDNRGTGYTNYGPGCNIAAPGGEIYFGDPAAILSTMPTESIASPLPGGGEAHSVPNYGYMQGTSMACPHVSGVAALGLSYAKKLGKTFTRKEFTSLLLASVNDIDKHQAGYKTTYLAQSNTIGKLNVSQFREKMGTGFIDAWKLLMNIEGTPFATIALGEEQKMPLSRFFGDGASRMTFLSVEMSDEDKAAIGLEGEPKVENGNLVLTTTKLGSAKILVKAIAGGDELGGGNNIGGMEMEREISVLVRNISSDNGGWL